VTADLTDPTFTENERKGGPTPCAYNSEKNRPKASNMPDNKSRIRKLVEHLWPHAVWDGIHALIVVGGAAVITTVVALFEWARHHIDIVVIFTAFVISVLMLAAAAVLIERKNRGWRTLASGEAENSGVAPSPSSPGVRLRILVSSPGISFRLRSDRTKADLDLFFTTSAPTELSHIEVKASTNNHEICRFIDSTPARIVEMSQHFKRVEATVTPQGLATISPACVISLFGTATFRDGTDLRHEPINMTTVAFIEAFGESLLPPNPSTEGTKGLSPANSLDEKPPILRIEMTPSEGPSDEMLLNIRNGGKRQEFRAQAALTARRNDPNQLKRVTYDLEWERTGTRDVTLSEGESCNLRIATARAESHPSGDLDYLELWGLAGTLRDRKEWSRWPSDQIEKPEYDLAVTVFGVHDFVSQAFRLRPGKNVALEMFPVLSASRGASCADVTALAYDLLNLIKEFGTPAPINSRQDIPRALKANWMSVPRLNDAYMNRLHPRVEKTIHQLGEIDLRDWKLNEIANRKPLCDSDIRAMAEKFLALRNKLELLGHGIPIT
jgi:hypothetical protein